jgi:hypothetical protein
MEPRRWRSCTPAKRAAAPLSRGAFRRLGPRGCGSLDLVALTLGLSAWRTGDAGDFTFKATSTCTRMALRGATGTASDGTRFETEAVVLTQR